MQSGRAVPSLILVTFAGRCHNHETSIYAVRRAKVGSNLTKAKKLFEASLSSDIDLLKEMKNIRKGKGQDDNVAGANGEEDIVEKFRLSSTLQVHLMSWA